MPLLVLAQQAASASDDASGRLSMVITALVVLAVLIAIATVVFWRLTRPEPVEPAMRWTAPSPEGSTAPSAATPSAATPSAVTPSEGVTAAQPEARAEQPRTAG